MTNYNQINIYRKQMQELGLNTKQYSKLIDMPYEAVKDIIYDKEGDYSMEIKNLLRKNMLDRHQEVEKNFENSKIKALEIKKENDYLKWYYEDYNLDLLKEKLKVSGPTDFSRKYEIKINDKEASRWFYSTCVAKKYLEKINKDVINCFAKQLYDILINDNREEYLREIPLNKVDRKPLRRTKNNLAIKEMNELKKWYNDFDIYSFIKKNQLNNKELAQRLGLAYSTMCQIVNKSYPTIPSIKKLYDFVKELESEDSMEEIEVLNEEVIEDDNNTASKIIKEEPVETEEPKVIFKPIENAPINSQDEILRRLLINRLTDEEKELILLFNGKLDI